MAMVMVCLPSTPLLLGSWEFGLCFLLLEGADLFKGDQMVRGAQNIHLAVGRAIGTRMIKTTLLRMVQWF